MAYKEPKSTVEMASKLNPPESKTSSLPLNPKIEEDIHDCSEYEENTACKTSMKNVLYEAGKGKIFKFMNATFFYIGMHECIYE